MNTTFQKLQVPFHGDEIEVATWIQDSGRYGYAMVDIFVSATRSKIEYLASLVYNTPGQPPAEGEYTAAYEMRHEPIIYRETKTQPEWGHWIRVNLTDSGRVEVFRYNAPQERDMFGIWQRQGDALIHVG